MDTQVRDAADAMKEGRSWMLIERPNCPAGVLTRQEEAVNLAIAELRAQAENYRKALVYMQEYLEKSYSPDEDNDSDGNMAYATVLHALEGGDVG